MEHWQVVSHQDVAAARASFVNSSAPRPSAIVTLAQLVSSGSKPLQVVTTDHERYWVKLPGNQQDADGVAETLATELIVSAVGEHLGIPTRPTCLIDVPRSIVPNRSLYPGLPADATIIAHGSADLPHCLASEGVVPDEHTLPFPERDDNARRAWQVSVLWQLCLGGDAQFLLDVDDDYSLWSFDHGMWFGEDGSWVRDPLPQSVVDARWGDLFVPPPRLANPSAEAALMQHRLKTLTEERMIEIVAQVPVNWLVPDDALAHVASVVCHRARLLEMKLTSWCPVSA